MLVFFCHCCLVCFCSLLGTSLINQLPGPFHSVGTVLRGCIVCTQMYCVYSKTAFLSTVVYCVYSKTGVTVGTALT
jgi:hypothetical protein